MSNHTPGPWNADEQPDAYGYGTIRPCDGTENGDTSAQPIATVYEYANARLIAAAPDLLAALRAAVEYLGCALAGANLKATGYDREAGVEEYQAALAAIAKAEGRRS